MYLVINRTPFQFGTSTRNNDLSTRPSGFEGQRAPQRVRVPQVTLVVVRRVQFFHADPLELCAERHPYTTVYRVLSSIAGCFRPPTFPRELRLSHPLKVN